MTDAIRSDTTPSTLPRVPLCADHVPPHEALSSVPPGSSVMLAAPLAAPVLQRPLAAHPIATGLAAARKVLSPSPTQELSGLFNRTVTHLQGAPAAGTFHAALATRTDIFYHWLYQKPSISGGTPYEYYGFYLSPGSTIDLTVTTQPDGDGWVRTVEFATRVLPGNLGSFGPIARKPGQPPLGIFRLAKLITTYRLDANGAVVSEKTTMGITFADEHSGKSRGPSRLEKMWLANKRKASALQTVPHEGTTLYLVDSTAAFREIWAREKSRLAQAQSLHQKESGETLVAGSPAHTLAFLKYTMLFGIGNAQKGDAARVARARRILGL